MGRHESRSPGGVMRLTFLATATRINRGAAPPGPRPTPSSACRGCRKPCLSERKSESRGTRADQHYAWVRVPHRLEPALPLCSRRLRDGRIGRVEVHLPEVVVPSELQNDRRHDDYRYRIRRDLVAPDHNVHRERYQAGLPGDAHHDVEHIAREIRVRPERRVFPHHLVADGTPEGDARNPGSPGTPGLPASPCRGWDPRSPTAARACRSLSA